MARIGDHVEPLREDDGLHHTRNGAAQAVHRRPGSWVIACGIIVRPHTVP